MACDFPDGTKWDVGFEMCVAGARSQSCDSISQTTCDYAYLIDGLGGAGYLGGKLIDGGFKVGIIPEFMEKLGIEPGDVIHKLNDAVLCEHNIGQYTPEHPGLIVGVDRYYASRVTQWRVLLSVTPDNK